MFCPKCGNNLQEGTNGVCSECGYQFNQMIPDVKSPKTSKKKKIAALMTLVLVLLIIAITIIIDKKSNDSNELIGVWQSTKDDISIKFNKGGTGVYGGIYNFEWTAEDGIITVFFYNNYEAWTEIHHYYIEDSTLFVDFISGDDDELEWPGPWKKVSSWEKEY